MISLSSQGAAALQQARAQLAAALRKDPGVDDLLARFDRWGPDLWNGLVGAYDAETVLPRFVELIAQAHRDRSKELRARDRERLLQPDWFQRPEAIGYVAYADRFAGDLAGVQSHIDYLSDLGVTYLHLMPLLEPRPAPNDGGYAVMDYRKVRSDLGTMKNLRELAGALHEAGIALTLDLVLNHVAQEHAWAVAARKGDAAKRDYFLTYPDRTLPDEYEKSLPEVFPAFAPGNFTWDDSLDAWVWTTFNTWQWDLNWANPDVLCEFADIILFLANQGVDCIRLDAIAFLWKRMGTNCQGEPEVHAITQALRAAARIATPALIFKAEAIVGPDDVVKYLGVGEHAGRISDLAYHNSLMVQIWSAFAMHDARLLTSSLTRFAQIPSTTAWGTYLRCHDDIGWAIDDRDAGNQGFDGGSHRAFLAEYYAGEFEGSPARGAHFQSNPLTGDRRTSGSAASLAGIEAALEAHDQAALTLAIDKVLCGYAIVLGFGGIPLIYMGDEIGLLNDYAFVDEPEHAADNRWLHRPMMDWPRAKAARTSSEYSGRLLRGLTELIEARKDCDPLHAATPPEIFHGSDSAILVLRRRHPGGTVVQVFNMAGSARELAADSLWPLDTTRLRDLVTGSTVTLSGESLRLPAYGVLWLVDSP